MRVMFLFLIAIGVTGSAFSTPPKSGNPKPQPAGSKRAGSTTLNFEEEDVGGKRRDPLGSIVNRSQVTTTTNLIQLRTNWEEEINDSMDYIGTIPPLQMP
jgi:hypothetical protein